MLQHASCMFSWNASCIHSVWCEEAINYGNIAHVACEWDRSLLENMDARVIRHLDVTKYGYRCFWLTVCGTLVNELSRHELTVFVWFSLQERLLLGEYAAAIEDDPVDLHGYVVCREGNQSIANDLGCCDILHCRHVPETAFENAYFRFAVFVDAC